MQPELERGLAHEANTSLAAIDQRELALRTRDRERHTRQTRAGAEVERRALPRSIGSQRQRVEQVSRDEPRQIASRYEIERRVPTTQQSRELQQPFRLRRLQLDAECSGAGFELSRFGHADRANFPECTSSIDRAAGVMPGMRAARARLSGRAASSFCFSSVESPDIDA